MSAPCSLRAELLRHPLRDPGAPGCVLEEPRGRAEDTRAVFIVPAATVWVAVCTTNVESLSPTRAHYLTQARGTDTRATRIYAPGKAERVRRRR